MKHALLRATPILLLLASDARAQDECSAATPIAGTGTFPFSTLGATTSPPAWPCAAGGSDVWYRWTAPNDGTFQFDTCSGTGYDSALEIFSGTCATLASIACNDDFCGLQTQIVLPGASAGTDYFLRVGGFAGQTGTGTVTVTDVTPPPPSPGCFADRATWLAMAGVPSLGEDFSGFVVDTPFDAGPIAIGTGTIEAFNAIGFRNFVDTPVFQFGDNNGTNHASCYTNQDPPAVTVLLALPGPTRAFGCRVSNGIGLEMTEMVASAGGTVLAVCNLASNDIDQFIGYVTPGNVFDAIRFRSATLVPGGGGEGFGLDDLEAVEGLGVSYCSPAQPNSTGLPGTIRADGSPVVSMNDVTLIAEDLPPGEFGYFLVGSNQGQFTPPGSQGVICLSCSGFQGCAGIGRYNQFGNIIQGPTGSIMIDLTALPLFPPVAVQPGEAWNFQCWYRDLGSSNFTDAISITFI